MGDGIESEGPSADSALTLDFGPATDPATGSDDTTKLSVVWPRSDQLRQYLKNKGAVSKDDRTILKAYLIAQLPTLPRPNVASM